MSSFVNAFRAGRSDKMAIDDRTRRNALEDSEQAYLDSERSRASTGRNQFASFLGNPTADAIPQLAASDPQLAMSANNYMQSINAHNAEQRKAAQNFVLQGAKTLEGLADNPQAFEQTKAELMAAYQEQFPNMPPLNVQGISPQTVRSFVGQAAARSAAGLAAVNPRMAYEQTPKFFESEQDFTNKRKLEYTKEVIAKRSASQPSIRIMSPEETVAAGLPANQSYKINTQTGDVLPITGTGKDSNTGGNPTEGERKVAALGVRLEGAMRILNNLESTDPGSTTPGYLEKTIGAGSEVAANMLRSSGRQQANAAQLDALDAGLTLATGAAYTKEQLANLATAYFPQIGDSEETKAAKAQRFSSIVEAARIAAGRAEPSINQALDNAGKNVSGPSSDGWSVRKK